ncbi:MAG TPA: alpha/beta hydrolase, partial [Holophagaceae bacterium]|nr:alpha/beta hydrolase [Holophagaceae bacterium]
RAGTQWSEASPDPLDADHVARDLHAALERAGLHGPYVLVGHSLGGLFVRVFADRHPAEVVGMVLVESSHPDQLARLSATARSQAGAVGAELHRGIWQQRLGWLRFRSHFEPSDWEAFPAPVQAQVEAWSGAGTWRAAWAEWAAWEATASQTRRCRDLGSLPLRVLTAGGDRNSPEDAAAWTSLQEELARLSTRGVRRVISGAHHDTLVTDPVLSRAVVQAVREVCAEAAPRSGASVQSAR